MAAPVLLAVGALGVGWVALSRARGTTPVKSGGTAKGAAQGAPGANVPIGTGGAAGAPDQGVQLVSPNETGGLEIDANTGADPTTSPEPGFSVGAPADPYGVQSDGDTITDTDTAMDYVNPTFDASQAKYGDTNGITSTQDSQAIQDLGPDLGMTW